MACNKVFEAREIISALTTSIRLAGKLLSEHCNKICSTDEQIQAFYSDSLLVFDIAITVIRKCAFACVCV